MIRYVIYAVLGIIVLCLAGAGIHLCRVYFKNKKEMSAYAGNPAAVTKNFGKVLVVYYSMSGNTRAIAEKIKEKTNADIYEIKTKDEMKLGPSVYVAIRKQLKTGQYPPLDGGMPDFESYDLIFVGSPVWMYTVATPVLSFLEQADFKGKKVVPFSTQGSNPGSFLEDFKARAKNAVILEGRLFNDLSKKYDSAVNNKIAVWLNSLEI